MGFKNESHWLYGRTKKKCTGYSRRDVFDMVIVGFQFFLFVLINYFNFLALWDKPSVFHYEYGDLVAVQMHVFVNFRCLIYRVHNTLHLISTSENPSSLRSTSLICHFDCRTSCYRKIFLCFILSWVWDSSYFGSYCRAE